MALVTTYHVGGFVPAAPAQNRREQYDSVAGTFTTWNASGTQTLQRALTAPEIAALTAQDQQSTSVGNGATLKTKAGQALTANATYLAIASPTVAQNTAQTKALTRQVNALIRLALNQLDSIADS